MGENPTVISSFKQSLYNTVKKGAFYTPKEYAKRISYLFSFPENEFRAIDPTCGDGEALLACVEGTKAVPYGVEVDAEVAPLTDAKFRDKGGMVVNTDFFRGLKSTYNCFDFCFANPPYMADDEGRRLEALCVERLYGLMNKQAYVAVIVPFHLLSDPTYKSFLKAYLERFEPIRVFRFDDKDYEEFKQVVVVGRKRNQLLGNPLLAEAGDFTLSSECERYFAEVNELEKLPYLPISAEDVEEKLIVSPGKNELKYFTTQEFNREKAKAILNECPLDKAGKFLSTPTYGVLRVNRPPIPLGKDHLYLSAVAGAGQGICGNENEGTLHLQRGVSKQSTSEEVEYTGAKAHMAVTTYVKTCVNIIQQDGTISTLE